MTALPFLFEAIVFDLDGTLVATDRFWVDAARVGARAAFAELQIERGMPTSQEWMSVVGLPLALGFDALFSDLTPAQRKVVLDRCVEEETKALSAGQAALIPGVEAMLTQLRDRGVRLGIASNCGAGYLNTMMNELGLARWVEEGRCLDSPGVRSKTAMVNDLLENFGTRSAVMIGDRTGDRDAAWQNGVPHVHFARGFATEGEKIECEATIDDMGEFVPRLERRATWIADTLKTLGFEGARGPRSIGVTGHTGSGKSLFAIDVHKILTALGRRAVVVALDDFQKPEVSAQDLTSTAFAPAERPLEHLRHAYDIEALTSVLLDPHAAGKKVDVTLGRRRLVIEPDDVLVFHGPFLLHPDLRARLERVVHLECSDKVCLRRVAGRDAKAGGPEGLLRVRRSSLPAQRGFDSLVPPAQAADLVLDGENALGPA
ncbi:MAG: HAD hydrolase-like protein [Planctomycetes bacterium]|nr:HAD hydrolase-like protein [Planctomycetota bacterium]